MATGSAGGPLIQTASAETPTKLAPVLSGLPGWGVAQWRNTLLLGGGLALAFFALYFLPALLYRPLCETPEARVAVVAREMLESDDWVVPKLGGERRGFKPPLPYWLTALSAQALSPEHPAGEEALTRAVQLPPAFSAALTVFVLVLGGALAFGRLAGGLAGACFGASFMVIYFAQHGFVDTTLMCACAIMLCGAAGVCCAPRPGVAAAFFFGAGLGLGVLVKEPIPFMLLGGPVVVEVLLRRRFNGRRTLLFLFGLVVAAVIVLPWFVLLAERTPGGWEALIAERKAMWQAGHVHHDRWVFYFYKLAWAVLPWTPVWLCAGVLLLMKGRAAASEPAGAARGMEAACLRFFALAFGLGFLAFYISSKQQDHYLLPVLPPLALVAGHVLAAFREPGGRKEERLAWTQLGLGSALGAALASAPAWSHACARYGVDFGVSVPAGLCVALLHFYLARQWVEGRPGRAVGMMAALALVAGAIYSVHWAVRAQETETIVREAPFLRAELEAAGPDARVYDVGLPAPLLMFYLNRPVKTLEDLEHEPSGQAAPRILIARRKDIVSADKPAFRVLQLARYLGAGVEEIATVSLPEGEDWPRKAGEALRAAGLTAAGEAEAE